MIQAGPLHKEVLEEFDALPQQLQVAARFVLDHPREVALLSMRDQAKQAGIPPTTMTRLARRLGFAGWDEIRALYAESVRHGTDGFSDRAGDLVERHRAKGETALAVDLFEMVSRQIEGLRSKEVLQQISAAAKLLARSRRIFVVGHRSSYSPAYQLSYACGLIGCDTRLVDAPGGLSIDQLHDSGPDDACVVVSIRPYARASLTTARYAAGRKLRIVSVTDSQLSPFVSMAAVPVIVGVESPSFFHTMAPAFTAVEAIAALVAAAKGKSALEALTAREKHFDALDILLMQRHSNEDRSTKSRRKRLKPDGSNRG
jgi:DNA-binding MurR/RpiR family transcriptional regulator